MAAKKTITTEAKTGTATGGKGAAEIEKAITAKEAELSALATERKAAEAAGDAQKTVEAEKKERRAAAQLDALKTAHRAATYTPPEPTDREELLKPLQKYQQAYNERLQTIRDSIAEADRMAAEIEKGLQEAAEKADTDQTLLLSAQRETTAAEKKQLAEMQERAKAIPVYPAGAIADEWAAICEKAKPEWDNRIMEIQTLAAAYTAAADALFQMHGALLDARKEYEGRQGGAPLATFFTLGGEPDGMTINKTYLARLKSIYTPVAGRKL